MSAAILSADRRAPLHFVKITGNQDDWEPSSETISADDDFRGSKLASLEAGVWEVEAAGGGESLSEIDAREWFLDGAADMPREIRAWAEDGAEPGELYRFVNNVACE